MKRPCATAQIFLKGMNELDVEEPYFLVNDNDRVEKLENYLPLLKAFYTDLESQCADPDNKSEEKLWELWRNIRAAVFQAGCIINASKWGESLLQTPPESLLEDIKNIYKDTEMYYVFGDGGTRPKQ